MVHNVEHWYTLVSTKEPREISHLQESASPSERKLAFREAFCLRDLTPHIAGTIKRSNPQLFALFKMRRPSSTEWWVVCNSCWADPISQALPLLRDAGPASSSAIGSSSWPFRFSSYGLPIFPLSWICRVRRRRPFQCLCAGSRGRNACCGNQGRQPRPAQSLRNRHLLSRRDWILRRTPTTFPRVEEASPTTG